AKPGAGKTGNPEARDAVAAFGPSAGRGASADDEAAPRPGGTPKEQFEHAFSLVTKADYAAAEKALAAFVETHPTDPQAGNAQYWLGRTYFVRKDYTQAAKAFAKVYEKYPKSAKAPNSVLDLGLSLAGLGDPQKACQAFNHLDIKFPNAAPDVKQREAVEKRRLGCK
ncbi:MAG: tol-pal system protein YbgF, partial [Alphaproteobacteria bacterium]